MSAAAAAAVADVAAAAVGPLNNSPADSKLTFQSQKRDCIISIFRGALPASAFASAPDFWFFFCLTIFRFFRSALADKVEEPELRRKTIESIHFSRAYCAT